MRVSLFCRCTVMLACLIDVGCDRQASDVPVQIVGGATAASASVDEPSTDRSTEVRGDATRSEPSSRLERREQWQVCLDGLRDASFAERIELIKLIIEYLKQSEVDTEDVQMAKYIAMYLEQIDEAQAQAFCDSVAEALHPREDLGEEVAWLKAISRRLQLVGKPFSLKGQTVDGQRVNWSDFRGRTVLVEFWATWCGPCLDEMQNVLSMYDHFHDRGFDVVGVSTDNDAIRLRQFLRNSELPWVTIHSPADDPNGLSKQFGIVAIPVCILVGADGNVIAINVRGSDLESLVESQLEHH